MSKKLLISWCNRILIGIVHCSVLVTPFIFTWVNDELFEFSKMIFIYVLVLVGVGALAIKTILLKKWIIRRTLFDIPIGLFLLSQVAATIFSIDPYTSLWGYYSRFNGGLISLISYILLYYIVTHSITKKQLPALFLSLMIGLFGTSLYAFPEHFGYSPSCLLITGDFSAKCWQQDVQHRVFGTFGQPNWLAAYSIMLFPLATLLPLPFFLSQIKKNDKKTTRSSTGLFSSKVDLSSLASISLAAVLVAYPTLLFTKSRSGFIGLSIGMLAFFLGWLVVNLLKKNKDEIPKKKSNSLLSSPILKYGAIILAFIVVTSLVVGTPYSSSFLPSGKESTNNTVESTQSANRLDEGGTDSGVIRTIVWRGALDVWKRYPIFGSGVETFAYSYYLDRPQEHNYVSEWDFLYNKAHNEFLNFLATTGIVGLGAYLLLLSWFTLYTVFWIFDGSQQTKNDLFDIPILLALLAGITSASVSNFFGFSTVLIMVLLYLFFAIANTIMKPKSDMSDSGVAELTTSDEKTSNRLSFLQLSGIGLVVFITFICLVSISNRWFADYAYSSGKNALLAGDAQEGIINLTNAVVLQPREALFYDELANTYSRLAINSLEAGLATQAATLAQASIDASTVTLQLNPTHLTFYKTRARIFMLLGQYNTDYFNDAISTLEAAISRAPTDPKLRYSLAQSHFALGDLEKTISILEEVIIMKPNYESARMYLAEVYEMSGNLEKAEEQYRYVLSSIAPNNTLAQEKLEELSTIKITD